MNQLRTRGTSITSLVAALLCSTVICRAQQPNRPAQYRLKASEVQIGEFVLKAAETRPLDVPADKPVWIGFKTDISHEASNEIAKKFPKWTHPELKQQNGVSGCGSLFGAATRFTPMDGKVSLLVKNPLDRPVSLLIYTDATQ